jgi:hypothetical protein
MLTPDDAAVSAFLQRSMVVQLATLSAKGRPFVTPIWFVADAGALYMTLGVETRAARNVTVHPDVVMLFGGERGVATEGRLRLRGVATCHRGIAPWRVLLRVAAKYYLGPAAFAHEVQHATRWALRVRYYSQVKGGAGYLCVQPTTAELLPVPTSDAPEWPSVSPPRPRE